MLYAGGATRCEPRWLYRIGVVGVSTVLAARAIGDRRYVGLFKRVRDTEFARRDTFVYSPLCAILTLAGAVVAT
jgi:hypothetical protein